MSARPVLTVAEATAPPRGIALVLHGGRSSSTAPVRPRQLAVLRMVPFATALHRSGADEGLVVARLRFAVRGWNGTRRSPVGDAFWAIDQLAERFPGLPVALVGHSMGGRTALYAAGRDEVSTVVGLAPWIEAGDPIQQLRGRRVLILHGTRDRMTSARGSAEYARLAEAAGASVSYVSVRAESHAMLRRADVWHRLTAGFVLGALLGVQPEHTAPGVLVDALAGESSLVV